MKTILLLLIVILINNISNIICTDNEDYIHKSVFSSSKIIKNCCNYTNDINNLGSCINNNHYKYGWFQHYKDINEEDDDDNNNNNKVITFGIVSYSDNNIIDYSIYSLAINTIWSEANGYTLRLYTINDNLNYDKYDSRWNKVLIVNDALNQWANEYDYIVWMDSDLIILDLDFRLEYIVQKYNKANLIFSKDPRIENGIVNTGMFLVKNTKWSKSFINDWWNKYDRSQGMDQHIFDKLWYDNIYDMKKNVKLLPFDEINSHFPAWDNQKDYNKVLHLAGSNNQFRKQSFKIALDEICYSYQYCSSHQGEMLSKCPIKSQLGLNQKVLKQLHYNSSITTPIFELLKEGNNLILQSYFINSTLLDAIIDIKQRLANFRQSGYNNEIDYDFTIIHKNQNKSEIIDNIINNKVDVCESIKLLTNYTYSNNNDDIVLYGLRWVYCNILEVLYITFPDKMYNDYSLLLRNDINIMKVMSIILQYLLDASFDLLVYNSDHIENYNILKFIAPYVDLFINSVPLEAKHITLYYKVKHREFSSNNCRDLNNQTCQLQYLFESYYIWKELDQLEWYGAGNGISNPYKEYSDITATLAAMLCVNNRAEEGLLYAQESIRLVKKLWIDDINEIDINVSDITILSLINKYIIAGECAKRCSITQSFVNLYSNKAFNLLSKLINSSSDLILKELNNFNNSLNNLKIPIDIFDTNCTNNKKRKWLKKKEKN